MIASPLRTVAVPSNLRWPAGRLLCLAITSFGFGFIAATATGAPLDLRQARIVAPPNPSPPLRKALALLVDAVAERTQIRWEVGHSWPSTPGPVIALGQFAALQRFAGSPLKPPDGRSHSPAAEGYRIWTTMTAAGPTVFIAGTDARGVLFGVGRLLRALHMGRGQVLLDDGWQVASAPAIALRGHQLGYRPKTNSYDGWTLPMWEQYIRDLVVFGTNAVELIPPRSDDAADSPHFPLPPMAMMIGMSRLLADYDLDVWIWYPALDADYRNAATVAGALDEWGAVFRQLPRVDAVFVPGGDPGHTQPRVLMDLLAKETQVLHRYHPKAQMWVSPQGFTQPWMEEFLAILHTEQPAWLNGVVFGPQVRLSLPALRAAVPQRYAIRRYPDITHSRQCQYPVPDWDVAFALTENREVINPRPTDQADIFHAFQKDAIGFISYSEGCNDDVNKFVWSGLGWDPNARVIDILRDYSRYFIGERYADPFAQGLLALERNWRGPLATNGGVETTLAQFRAMEAAASPQDRLNWRFQQALYRAYYDAYIQSRLRSETELEARATEVLRSAPTRGALAALERAERILDRAVTDRVAADLRARIFELGEALFQSIRMQLSVERYQAIGIDRGATLDTLDVPLNNRPWLRQRFAAIRQQPTEAERLASIAAIVNWTNPGPGGFYDDLGSLTQRPHVVRAGAYRDDPGFMHSSFVGFASRPDWRLSWCRHGAALYETPLKMRYTDLDPAARYSLRVIYAGDSFRTRIRLVANDGIEVHPYVAKPPDLAPLEFTIPPAATADGVLELSWQQELGRGGNGRGCHVAEVWLLREPSHKN